MRAVCGALLIAYVPSLFLGQEARVKAVHISGQATDTCGLPLMNARVTVRLPGTGATIATATAAQDGEFDTPVVPPGTYTLQVETPAAELSSQTLDASQGDVDLLVVAKTKLIVCPATRPPLRTQKEPTPQFLDNRKTDPAVLPKVEERGGNIYFTAKDGKSVQLTSSGVDSSPSLSKNYRWAVFLREKYTVSIVLSRGVVRDKSLWIADTSRKKLPRLLLVGNSGLGEFRLPRFSPDGKRLCFEARSWATDYSVWTIEIGGGKVSRDLARKCP